MIAAEVIYKKTGIVWIPEVPKGWSLVRIKNLFLFKKEIVGSNSNKFKVLSLTIHSDGIIERNIENSMGKFPASFDGYQIIRPDSIVLCLFDMDVTPRIVGYSSLTGIISAAYTNLVPKQNVYSKYYYYYFLNQDRDKSLFAIGKGIRVTLREDSFGSLFAPFPTYDEQKAIADFLDAQSAKITRFIQSKQHFIELLKEQRQSIITNAVTKGINDGVKMKETGIDWMPEVPEHWEIRRLKYLVELYKHNKSQTNSTGYDFKLALENIDNWTGKYVESASPDFEGEGRYFQEGDVLFGKLRPYLAKAFLPEKKGVCVSEILVFTPNSELIKSEFLFQRILTKGFIDIVDGSTYGAKMPRASWDFIGNMRIAFPPTVEEQKRIVEHIKTETHTLDIAISKAEREIELIKEYREAMIAEAVTGKMR